MVGCFRLAPPRGELGHQRSAGNHSRAGALHQVHHTVGHAVEIGHGVTGRDLHGDGATPDGAAQRLLQFLPAGVAQHLSREPVHRAQLDLAGDGHGLAVARKVDEQATGPGSDAE